ncbi:MAG TPA: HIT domain-containing protein [Victivallales bacterium]|nr:HIT domain-containing protein [Victivallales bacterium]
MDNQIIIYRDDNFIASQCRSCNIPGYIILEPIENIYFLHNLNADSLNSLIVILAKVEEVICRTIKPENIYIAKFGEECLKVHFHIFPRTKEITEKYLKQHSNKNNLNGPQIFDWARREYKLTETHLSKKVIETANLLKINMYV